MKVLRPCVIFSRLPLLLLFVCEYEEPHPQDICIIHEEDCAKAAESGRASAPVALLSSTKIGSKQQERNSPD